MKGLWVWILGPKIPLISAPRPKPSAGTPVGRVQDQDQDQDDEQEHVRSPKPANSCNSHVRKLGSKLLVTYKVEKCKSKTKAI